MSRSNSYIGGKGGSGVAHTIIRQMPPHSVYVEPFLGWGRVFRAKLPANRSILIDMSEACIARVIAAGLPPGTSAMVGDALELLTALIPTLPADSVIYADPPYLLSTRGNRRYYDHEMDEKQHRRMLEILHGARCRVMVSGYWSELYGAALQGWRCCRYLTRTRQRTVEECLWCNFQEPEELHDWRYAGANFRERLRLKRLATRWVARLEAMPEVTRGYLLNGIQQRFYGRLAPAPIVTDDDGVTVPKNNLLTPGAACGSVPASGDTA